MYQHRKPKNCFQKNEEEKSSGCDGLGQEHLAAGAPTLTDIKSLTINSAKSEIKLFK